MEECISVNHSKPKRVRSANYSIQERKLLFIICSRFEEILKCKKTDIVSIRKKDEAWEKVTNWFNEKSNSGIWRDKSSLKCHYENCKRKNRAKLLNKNRECSFNDSNYSNTDEESNTSHHESIYTGLNDPSSALTVHRHFYKNEDSISINGEVVVKTDKNVQNWEHLLEDSKNRHNILKDNDSSKLGGTIDNLIPTIVGTTKESQMNEEQFTCSNPKSCYDRNYNNKNGSPSTNLIAVQKNENGDAVQRKQSILIKDAEVFCVETVKLSKELLQAKTHMVQFQLEKEKAEFELRKKALELDIQIREKYLEKLNSTNGFNISSLPKLLK